MALPSLARVPAPPDPILGLAEAFRADDLLELLGIDISPARLKCALLSLDTVAHALADDTEEKAEEKAGAEGSASGAQSQ